MNSVERVKNICKERKIPISQLEKDLGFSNGYVSQLRKGVFPDDRLQMISEYLGVSVSYLMNGREEDGYYLDPEAAQIAQEIFDNKEMRMLFDVTRNATAKRIKAYHDMIKSLENQENGE